MPALPNRFRPLLLALLTAGACSEAGTPLTIDATGSIAAAVFLDRNANNLVDPGSDRPLADLRIAVVRAGGDTIAASTTDQAGTVRFLALPVGSYRLAVSPSTLGDSLRVIGVEAEEVTVTPADTQQVTLAIGYPVATANEAYRLPAGRLVTLEGVALHAGNLFGDSTLHVLDATGVARVARFLPVSSITAGDSLRVLARVGSHLGRPALVEASAFVLGRTTALPVPRGLRAAEASTAQGGRLDGTLVQLSGTRIVGVAALPNGDTRLRVSDETGEIDVVLRRMATDAPLLPGVTLDVTGLLFPSGIAGEFVVRPRSGSDLVATVPRRTAAEIRTMAPGSVVTIEAVALNGQAAFGDNSLHLADPTGAIRAVDVAAAFVFAGDSVRVRATVGTRDGQAVLTQAVATVLGRSAVPPPVLVSTQAAASAGGGRLDAALVEVRGVVIEAVLPPQSGDLPLRVNDGSGPVQVLIDRDTGIGTTGLVAGGRLDIAGLLAPGAGGTWLLKPRSPADLQPR
jgi:hypothetical protein